MIVNANNLPIKPGLETLVVWDYHVVPIIKLKDNQLYVFDPSLRHAPMSTNSFYAALSLDPDSTILGKVTCLPNTYDPNWKCFDPNSLAHFENRPFGTGSAVKKMQEKLQLHLDRYIFLF